MAAAPRSNDLGILYAKNGDGSGTYLDITGTTQSVGTLTTSYTEQVTVGPGLVDYSHPYVGASPALTLFCDVSLSAATGIKVKLQGRADAVAPWADLQSAREDTGAVAAEHTLTAGTVVLQTASILAVPQVRVVAAAVSAGALAAGDSVVVRGRVA